MYEHVASWSHGCGEPLTPQEVVTEAFIDHFMVSHQFEPHTIDRDVGVQQPRPELAEHFVESSGRMTEQIVKQLNRSGDVNVHRAISDAKLSVHALFRMGS